MKKINLLILIFLISLSGCASPAKTVNMMVDPPKSESRFNEDFKNAIYLDKVTGGEETNPLWTSEVGHDEFQEALKGSLNSYQYLADSLEQSKFILNATLVDVSQPAFGFNMTVETIANYQLIDSRTKNPYKTKVVNSSYTAELGDSLIGAQRLRFANEGSVKKNIELFIQYLNNNHN